MKKSFRDAFPTTCVIGLSPPCSITIDMGLTIPAEIAQPFRAAALPNGIHAMVRQVLERCVGIEGHDGFIIWQLDLTIENFRYEQ